MSIGEIRFMFIFLVAVIVICTGMVIDAIMKIK